MNPKKRPAPGRKKKSDVAVDIRNRVIEMRTMSRDELHPNPKNWRRHPETQRAALRGLLKEIGIAGVALAYRSKRNGNKLTLIDGHLRRDEISERLPVAITDLNDEEADLLLASYDPLSAMAETDSEQLNELLEHVRAGDAALQQMLTDLTGHVGAAYSGEDQTKQLSVQYQVLVICKTEREQARLLASLTKQGQECRALIS